MVTQKFQEYFSSPQKPTHTYTYSLMHKWTHSHKHARFPEYTFTLVLIAFNVVFEDNIFPFSPYKR